MLFQRRRNRLAYRHVTTKSKIWMIALATAVLYVTTIAVGQTGSSGSSGSSTGTSTQQTDTTKAKGTSGTTQSGKTTGTSTSGKNTSTKATTGTKSETQTGEHPINKTYATTGGKQSIKDARLAEMIGTWRGTSTIQNQTGPVEVTFKPTLDGQWLEGKIVGFKDKAKKSLVYQGVVYMKADEDNKDNYFVYAFDNWGEAQSGKGKFDDGKLSFDWEYAGGGGEEAKLTFPSSGHMVYEGKIKAKDNEMTIALDLNRSGKSRTRNTSSSGSSNNRGGMK